MPSSSSNIANVKAWVTNCLKAPSQNTWTASWAKCSLVPRSLPTPTMSTSHIPHSCDEQSKVFPFIIVTFLHQCTCICKPKKKMIVLAFTVQHTSPPFSFSPRPSLSLLSPPLPALSLLPLPFLPHFHQHIFLSRTFLSRTSSLLEGNTNKDGSWDKGGKSEQEEIIILGDLNCNMLQTDGSRKQLPHFPKREVIQP